MGALLAYTGQGLADLDDGHAAAEHHDDAHLQHHPEGVPDAVRPELVEGLRAVAALDAAAQVSTMRCAAGRRQAAAEARPNTCIRVHAQSLSLAAARYMPHMTEDYQRQ